MQRSHLPKLLWAATIFQTSLVCDDFHEESWPVFRVASLHEDCSGYSCDQWGIVGSWEEDPGGTVPAHPIRSRAPAIDVTGHCIGDLDPLAEVGFARLPRPQSPPPALPCHALSGEVTVTHARLGTGGALLEGGISP